ncbi:hypothetical protein FAZ19_08960 [Sphingobacterium alkalisoli]|uniref:Uncharacterized protein n=1 Tax=Sphingobacterium alkalisoli TaxID=1874115 RepID=A0A4U0H6S7_9SPHI|nr:hypothetical protein [Sphingobacterium alkalisoli]TJY67014.1 hypothetical protein FAZ19_08960 [Sphingobacterium alkalisoli]GGH12779.1 hypothetical protein GCM10011418_12540 [Sphingobacterium alkalisoli]
MDIKVKKSVEAGINIYANLEKIEAKEFQDAIESAFNAEVSFMDKVKQVDAVFDDYQSFEELREVFFDLLMINFFSQDVQKLEEDYLDSEEWEAIEEETLDRGTELLNMFLYLKECADDNIAPELEDYLKEFLLVEEDEFQDEYRIYEKVIANQILVESDYSEIANVSTTVHDEDELYELFNPIVSFFYEPNPSSDQLAEFTKHAKNKSLETAFYQIITNFNK